MVEILDTNLIIRHLTEDNLDQSRRARSIFLEIESGAREVYLSEAVLVETAQVLASKALYNLSRDEMCTDLAYLLALRGVSCSHRRAYQRATELYRTASHLSFVDCLCVAHAERFGAAPVLSFDRGFDRRSLHSETPVRRVEPG